MSTSVPTAMSRLKRWVRCALGVPAAVLVGAAAVLGAAPAIAAPTVKAVRLGEHPGKTRLVMEVV